MINWEIGATDLLLIRDIVKRVIKEPTSVGVNVLDAEMDLMATHANGCPLKLKELLEAKDFDFWHDINGIGRNINRGTGELENCFLPRYAA